MELTGKTYLFVEKVDYQGGKFNRYSTTISHKNEDGTYINTSLEVKFTKEFLTPDKEANLKDTECYEMDIKKSWLDTAVYQDKEGKNKHKIFLKISDAKILSVKKIDKSSKGLPF